MTGSFAVDTSAVADLLRADRPDPPPLHEARYVFLPLPVLGELYAGAYLSRRVEANLKALEETTKPWPIITPDSETARIYGHLRGQLGLAIIGQSKRTDLWIGAVCIQHDLLLLTSDPAFDTFPNLKVLHW